MRFFFSFLALILFCFDASGQVQFRASADARQVVEGGRLEVSFTLANAEGRNFRGPNFGKFKVVSGPNQSSQISIVNGKTTQKLSLIYILQASNVGTYNIGRASIQVGNQRISSNPLKIEVVKGRDLTSEGENAIPLEERVFVRAELSDSAAYIGQQILLNYKLYTTEDIQSFDITSQPDFDGFYVENVKDFRSNVAREVINGIQYKTRILKSFSLFPQQTGSFSFDPMTLWVYIPYKDKNSRSFFFNTKVKPASVETNGFTITVNKLPDNPPRSFSGGVGEFTMRSFLNQNDLSTDDALIVTMLVTGTGDGRKITYPKFDLPKEFEMYDPKISKDENVVQNGKVINYKTFEYVAVPLKPGQFKTQAEFSYFSVLEQEYVTLKSDTFYLNVTKGTRPKSERHSFISGAEDLEMKPQSEQFNNSKVQAPLFASTPFVVASSTGVLLFLAMVFFKLYKSKEEEIDPEVLKRENAKTLALQKLNLAKNKMEEAEERAFYEEIALGFWGYASDKLGIDPADISKTLLTEKFKDLNVQESLIQDYLTVLSECEKVNYAGVSNTDMDSFYNHCFNLLTSIEAKLK